jgi:ribosomal protein S27AE
MTREERRARKLARAVSRRVAVVLEAQRREAQAAARGLPVPPSVLPEATRVGVRRWRRAHPEGPRAHKFVYAAVREGRIPRPDQCEGCGRVVRLHGHHDDYTKPLQVRWLCGSCHRLAHGRLRAQAEEAKPSRSHQRRLEAAAGGSS